MIVAASANHPVRVIGPGAIVPIVPTIITCKRST
jgi:hypothetical protein